MGTSLTIVGSLSLNVSRVSEQEWVRGWWRCHGSPSTRARTELVTWYSVRSEGNREVYLFIWSWGSEGDNVTTFCLFTHVWHSSAAWTFLCSWWAVFHPGLGLAWTPLSSQCGDTGLSVWPALERTRHYAGCAPALSLAAWLQQQRRSLMGENIKSCREENAKR